MLTMVPKRIISLATILLVTATLLETTTAATYIVGDNLGWTIPSDPTTYVTWASQHNFTVDDVLVFNFGTGQHNVARVTKEAFDSCNSTSPISLNPLGPANITLGSSGEQYFFCTVGQHCSFGQKLTVNVRSGSSSPVPMPNPTPPPEISPTPSQQPPVSEPSSWLDVPPTPGPSPVATPPSTAVTPPPTQSLPPPPSSGGASPPPSSGGASPPPSPPSNAGPATAVATTIYVIFVSAAIAIMF